MIQNAKALVVILVVAWIVFRLARPLCASFMPDETFVRRRNVWLALTVVAFLSPAFWMYAAVALVLLYWAGQRDENPLALYVLVTFTVPNVRYFISLPLINQLFDLTQYRILSFVLVLPAILRQWKAPETAPHRGLKSADVLVLAFLVLQVALSVPYQSTTVTMRRSFLFAIDTFVVFYAFSRLVERAKIADVIACFWVACMIMAPLAVFESLKGWLLYTGLSETWGDPNIFSYLMRGGTLRTQLAANHSLNLGFVLSVGVGCLLYVRSYFDRAVWGTVAIAALVTAVYFTGSRGAWLTTAFVVILFTLLRPHAARKLVPAALIGLVVVGVMYVTPLKESVLDRLPIIGTADQDTVEYRQQLAEVSWRLIWQNPFFGDPFVASRMDELKQGQGIIDIVNGYLFAALFTGLVGLTLMVSVFFDALIRGGRAFLQSRSHDLDAGVMGAALISLLLASMFFIATAGYGTTTYILSALLLSYATAMARQGVVQSRGEGLSLGGLRHAGNL